MNGNVINLINNTVGATNAHMNVSGKVRIFRNGTEQLKKSSKGTLYIHCKAGYGTRKGYATIKAFGNNAVLLAQQLQNVAVGSFIDVYIEGTLDENENTVTNNTQVQVPINGQMYVINVPVQTKFRNISFLVNTLNFNTNVLSSAQNIVTSIGGSVIQSQPITIDANNQQVATTVISNQQVVAGQQVTTNTVDQTVTTNQQVTATVNNNVLSGIGTNVVEECPFDEEVLGYDPANDTEITDIVVNNNMNDINANAQSFANSNPQVQITGVENNVPQQQVQITSVDSNTAQQQSQNVCIQSVNDNTNSENNDNQNVSLANQIASKFSL